MKPLDQIIRDYYPEEQKAELEKILKAYNLYDLFFNTIEQLKPHLEEQANSNRAVGVLASGLLTGINNELSEIKTAKDKIHLERLLSNMTSKVLHEFLFNTALNKKEILDEIKDSVQLAAQQFDYDYEEIEKLVDFDQMSFLISLLEKKESLANPPVSTTDKIASSKKVKRYIWTQKGNLQKLVIELLNKKYIKSKVKLFYLFEKPTEDLLVQWNPDFKPQLAHLLFRFFSEGYARMQGSKGYFSYAEQHFVDFENNHFPKNYLKKYSSEINQNPDSFTRIIKDIDDILQMI